MDEAIASLEAEINGLEELAIEAELRAGECADPENATLHIRLAMTLRLSVKRMRGIVERFRGLN